MVSVVAAATLLSDEIGDPCRSRGNESSVGQVFWEEESVSRTKREGLSLSFEFKGSHENPKALVTMVLV